MRFLLTLSQLTFFICFFISSCANDSLTLKKTTIDIKSEIDTLEAYPIQGVYLVSVTNKKALGKFEYHFAIIKKMQNSDDLIYEVKDGKEWPKVSKEYIALTKEFPEAQQGWFYMKNGKLMAELPKMHVILDSLKSMYSGVFFVNEKNGYIPVYTNGKIVKSFDYGHFVTKYTGLNFDSLNYGLYRLEGDSLKIVSANGNDLFNQSEGIFFIPPPGYGVIRKFNKQQVFDAVDSAGKAGSPPNRIIIDASE